jgi:hypothetical protein
MLNGMHDVAERPANRIWMLPGEQLVGPEVPQRRGPLAGLLVEPGQVEVRVGEALVRLDRAAIGLDRLVGPPQLLQGVPRLNAAVILGWAASAARTRSLPRRPPVSAAAGRGSPGPRRGAGRRDRAGVGVLRVVGAAVSRSVPGRTTGRP